ncbi:unnamed protein product [Candidula unifasciata]|uniref:Ankyrin repeat domain-containing protein 39 n=1 Tax=Candidula unifasciata TaxID=100452 RepID=A0A8S4A2K4_9EUPU|nr:unnamed protein product [Candidula unifasciata]
MSQHGAAHGCSGCGEHNCYSHAANPSVHQTLDELDFDRGLWSSALAGDNDDLKRKLIHSKGTDVNKVDKSGYTALHYACRNGQLETCKILLTYQADVNATTQSSKATPLHRASYMGHSEIVSLLLQHNADPRSADCDGMTPLHKAAENDHAETVKILIKANPDVANVKDNRFRKPVDLAKSDLVRTILSSMAPDH